MMKFLRKYQYHIFLFTTVVFLLGSFIGFGSYFLSGASASDSIAEVNGQKIPLRLYYSHYNRAMEQLPAGVTPDDATRKQKRDEALRDLVQMEVFHQLAQHFRIVVPDQQVAQSMAQVPAFFDKNGQFSPEAYQHVVTYQLKMTLRDFEEEQRRTIEFVKLRWLVQSCLKVTDREEEIAWTVRGAEFTQKNAYELDDKGKQKRRRSPEEIRQLFREQLWQEKVMWAFNQWFGQLGQNTHVKPHLELIEGGAK